MPERRPRLRTVLLMVNLAILVLPLGGIAFLRLYENELIRGTEAQLLAQGALVREAFRRGLTGRDATEAPASPIDDDALRAAAPRLDIARDRVLPPAPDGLQPVEPPDPVAAAAASALGPVLRAAARETLAGIRILDRNGTVVASTGSELGLSLAPREEVHEALAGRRASVLRKRSPREPSPSPGSVSRGQRYRVFVSIPVEIDGRVAGVVVLSRTPLDIGKALYLNRRSLLVGGLGVLAVVVPVTVLTSATISRPLAALVDQFRRVARGERNAAIAVPRASVAEIAELAGALSGMARALEQRASYIRSFASHVSHEFKTPLAAIRGSTELLSDHWAGMSDEERAKFIARIDDACGRLDRLVSRLLEQARADVFEPGGETVDVRDVVRTVALRARQDGFDVVCDLPESPARAPIGADVLAGVIESLLDNARQHGGPAAKATITVRGTAVTIADDGVGITQANAARLFTPFFTTSRDRGGSGLGLTIARSLIEAHGGTIALAPSGRGAVFEIRLPPA